MASHSEPLPGLEDRSRLNTAVGGDLLDKRIDVDLHPGEGA